MKKIFLLFFLFYFSYAWSCYSILTKVDETTPVAPINTQRVKVCSVFHDTIDIKVKKAYYGCYRYKKEAEYALKHSKFHFIEPKIVYHRVKKTDLYIISPRKSGINKKKKIKELEKIYKNNTPNKLLKKFPKKLYGNNFEIEDVNKLYFLPAYNIFYYKKYDFLPNKILILYDGVYSLEELYKIFSKKGYIKKTPQGYQINISIVVSPTASLIIKNKKVLLEGYPNVVNIFYFGRLYISNSKFIVWDRKHNKYLKREKIPEDKILFINYERPRPYILGLTGSKAIVLNSVFRGLGYHSVTSTFGYSVANIPSKNLKNPFFMFLNYKKPSIKFIGNEVYDSTMGFYTNGAENSLFLGNFFHDNVIYNFDPHDYSKNLVCARNISLRAKYSNGLIISREVTDSVFAENLSLKNHSNGIMLDRNSYKTFVYKNISFDNGYSGISIQETPKSLIDSNIVFLNRIDGIIARNSLRTEITENIIDTNGKNGAEVFVKDLSFMKDRNFQRDPYVKAASAVIDSNVFKDNFQSDIKVSNFAAVKLKNNKLNLLNPKLAGDLEFFITKIIKNKGNFKLYGLGFPFLAKSSDLITINSTLFYTARDIYSNLTKDNIRAYDYLFYIYSLKNRAKESKKALLNGALKLNKLSLAYIGYMFLSKSRQNGWNEKDKFEGLVLLIESGILGNEAIFEDLIQLKYFVPGLKELLKAYKEAIRRMKKGILFNEEFYKKYHFKLENAKEIKNAVLLFEYRLKYANIDFYGFLKKIKEKMNTFTLIDIKRYEKAFKLMDKIKYLRNNYQKEMLRKAREDQICRRYLLKKELQSKEIEKLLKLKRKELIKKYLPEIKNLLEKINIYRNKKITINELLKGDI